VDLPESGERAWVGPLVATFLMQATAAFLTRLVPTIAPAVMPEFGLTETAIGYLAAVTTFGSIAFLLTGNPLIRRTGPIRALQIGLALGGVGVALLSLPTLAAPVMASFLVGLGYGPSTPAGSDVLQRHAPARHRNLIFSVKQAGVPLGGVAAGVVLAPIAEAAGWRATLVVAGAVVLATIAAVQPLRARIDAERNRHQPLTPGAFFGFRNLVWPIASLKSAPGLPRLAFAGACFAVGQGCWVAFLVTYLVTDLALSLTSAGLLFAVMMATGVFGRILLGFVSDRLGSGILTLKLVAATSAATSLALALTSPGWPLWAIALLAGVGGVTVSSWNGVQIAEIARLAPRHLVGETAAGSTVLIFLGYIVGPSAFAALVGATGRFDLAFMAVAAATLAALFGLMAENGRALR
jgi:predicted MFS family arabinose efflux permease